MIEVVMQARNDSIADLIHRCAKQEISFSECCQRIHNMGFKTTSVYEMVCAEERAINATSQHRTNN